MTETMPLYEDKSQTMTPLQRLQMLRQNPEFQTLADHLEKLFRMPGMTIDAIYEKLSPIAKEIFKQYVMPRNSQIEQNIQQSPIAKSAMQEANAEKESILNRVLESLGEVPAKVLEIVKDIALLPLQLLLKIPKPYLLVGAVLLGILGSSSAVISFLKLGASASASATWGSMQTLLGNISISHFQSMIPELLKVFGGNAAGLPTG